MATKIFILKYERWFIGLFSLAAAIRVFIFSAAYPFFNNIDEEYHADLVIRYSLGHIPHALEPFADESRPCIIIYSSREYSVPPESFPGGKYPPPPWQQSPEKIMTALRASDAAGRSVINTEADQAPLYYTLAGCWWRVLHFFNNDEGFLLYSVHFLNAWLLAGIVWLGYLTAKTLFPERRFIVLATPALLAFFPQSVFYSIENDVLSPITVGLAFLFLLRWLRDGVLTPRLAVFLGLSCAAAFLTKLSNLPFLTLFGMVGLFELGRMLKNRIHPRAALAVLLLLVCALGPTLCRLLWVKHYFGDFMGAAGKIHSQGWTPKSFPEWWHHPIFTPAGLWTFVVQLVSTFWHGQLTWHGVPLAPTILSFIYVGLSLGGIGLAMVVFWRSRIVLTSFQRRGLWLCLGCIVAGVAFLGFMSSLYDFGACPNPSRANPYFSFGRLILGAVIPFFIFFVYGLDRAFQSAKNIWLRPLILASLMLFMLISEIATTWPVFLSQYNWYHL